MPTKEEPLEPPIARMALAYKDSQAAFANAKDFIDEARLLRRRGSYGHAFALLVLAEEEIGKGFLLQWETLGFEMPQSVLRSHQAKQAMMMQMVMVDYLISDVIFSWRRIMSQALDAETKRKRMEQAVKRIYARKMKDPEAAREAFFEEMTFYFTVDKRKMDGLYVDTAGGGGARTPRSFTGEEVEAYARKVKRRYKRIVEFWGGPKEVSNDSLVRQWEMWQDTQKALGDRVAWMYGYFQNAAKSRSVIPDNLPPLPEEE